MTDPAAALVFAEPSGIVRMWNPAAESLFGHRAAEAIGQTLDLIIPPEFRARHWAGFRAAMAAADGNTDRASSNIPALHRNGTVMQVMVRLLVIHDSRNRVAGAMAVFTPDDDSASARPRA